MHVVGPGSFLKMDYFHNIMPIGCLPCIWEISWRYLCYVHLHISSQNCKCVPCPLSCPSAWIAESCDGGIIGLPETQCSKSLDDCMVWSGPHAGCVLGQIIGIQVLFSQVSWTETSIQEIFRYQGCLRIIWMCGQSFWEESADVITLDTKVMISAEGMKAANEAKEQTG